MADRTVRKTLSNGRRHRAWSLNLVMLVTAGVVVLRVWWSGPTATSFQLMLNGALATRASTERQVAYQDPLLEEFKKRGDDSDPAKFNITLQLGSGWPGSGSGEITQGQPWAQCWAQEQKGKADDKGNSPKHDNIYETWLMLGVNTDLFRFWKQGTEKPVSVRCTATTMASALSEECLECVPLVNGSPQALLNLHAPVSGCVTRGFCKSGSVSMPSF